MAQSLLAHCEKVLILGATLSGDFDRQLSQFEVQNSAKALVFDALGSALIDEESGHRHGLRVRGAGHRCAHRRQL